MREDASPPAFRNTGLVSGFDRFFWKRSVPRMLMLLDDGAYRGHRAEKVATDGFSQKRVNILSRPAQGLRIEPAYLY